MPVCSDCGDPLEVDITDVVDDRDVERLYRAVADGEPKLEIMQMIYEMFGASYGLAPPYTELRLAERLNTVARA